jgi:disulfide bond formation protein DsbB
VISHRLDSLRVAGYEVYRSVYREDDAMSQTTALPFTARGGAGPATTASLAILVVAAATLAGAWFFQLVLEILPCPLCLEQRYAYYFVVPFAALVALSAAKGAPRGVVLAGLAILALVALGSAAFGAYHTGVEWKFWQGPTDCTGPIVNFGKAGSLFDNLDRVKVIRCDEVQFRFLGISLAGYNALISLLMAAIAAWGIAKTAKS